MPSNLPPGVDILAYRRYIEDALVYAGGTHTFEDVRAAVDAGTLHFWPGASSVVVTEIVEYPQKKVLHIFLAGGTLSELEQMQPLILDWGREQGCTAATLAGRKGWDRTFLTRQGWEQTLVVLETPLDGRKRGRE